MLDNLKDLFKDGLGYTHTAAILQQVSQLVNIVNVQYTKDVAATNSALDHICALLKSHKQPVVATEQAVEVPASEVQNAVS